ncbi:MAG: hypothetical protein SFX73_38775 [Kofleriaceae bacterium]|nr:hypothetical protein [Kofleriaceae bacterium]
MKHLALLVVGVAAGACGGDAATPTTDIDVSDLTYAPCDAATRIGGFEVVRETAYTGAQGQVFDRVLPASVPSVVRTEGACALVQAPSYTCTPACAATQVCSSERTCVNYPVAHSVGTVALEGLAAAVVMAPRAPTYFYTNPTTLPHPGYADGAGIQLTADGGDGDAFTLRGWGVEALAVTSADIVVERYVALPLTWTPPALAGPAKIELSININGHGLVGQHIECTVDDTGAYTIPATLITDLVDAGTSGFPTITFARTTADAATLASACVDLRVHSSVNVDVTIPGVESCDDDDDCTPHQTCGGDLTCG